MHRKIHEIAADCVEYRIDKAIAAADPRLDSPLERMFLEALILAHLISSRGVPPINGTTSTGTDPIFGIKTQYSVGSYRADFLLISYDARAVLIECDGHDYHERTKEQAARDRKKDRDIQAAGHLILRYTGSEIWADPMKCVGNAIDTLFESPRKISAIKKIGDMTDWMEHGDDYQKILETKRLEREAFFAAARKQAEATA